MALQLLIDYLTGKQALVNNITPSSTKQQFTLDFLTGQFALVLMPGGSITPPTPSYFVPVFFNLIPQ